MHVHQHMVVYFFAKIDEYDERYVHKQLSLNAHGSLDSCDHIPDHRLDQSGHGKKMWL